MSIGDTELTKCMKTISIPIQKHISQTMICNWSINNCSLYQYELFSLKNLTSLTTRKYSTTTYQSNQRNSYTFTLKLIGILIAVFVFGMIIIHVCYKFCNSYRSSNNLLSNRRMPVVRSQIATIELSNFKPDLPPSYPDAIANIDNDENKLPSYNELQNVRSELSRQT
ncbi:unnamed protein product [Rotaria sordida]|uniref:Uncharacterized protein n=2 Tax=Rotaria sordida TaxID=392033 RepID=A0A818UWE2_9BILA|nr:unnamed protein product [Rotaria sordida]